MHHTPQRLGQGGDAQVEPVGHAVQVALHHARRHEHLLREPAEQVEQVLAQDSCPRAHARQAPHGAESPQNTRSPTATASTPGPTAATTPANSCPSRDG